MNHTSIRLLVVLLMLLPGTSPAVFANDNPEDITSSYTYNGKTYIYNYYGDLLKVVSAATSNPSGNQSNPSIPATNTGNQNDPVVIVDTPIVNVSIPHAIPDTSSTELNTPVNINILANDNNLADLPIKVLIIDPANNGKVTIEPDNTLTYIPNPDFSGTDNLMYEISDTNGDKAVTNVAVNVKCNTCLSDDVLVTLKWNPNQDDVQGYAVYFGPTQNTADQLASDLPLNSGLLDPNSPSVQLNLKDDLGLAQGNGVCFRLKAYNESGFSDFSSATCLDSVI